MRNKPLPVFFCASNAPWSACPPPPCCLPLPVPLPPSDAVRSSLPALLVVYRGVRRDGTRSLSRHCPPALPSLLTYSGVGRLRLFRLRRSACSVGGAICVGNVMR